MPFSTFLGYGLGFRSVHYEAIVETRPAVDFFECMTEDYIDMRSYGFQCLTRIREHYPVVMHGVSLSIGGVDPLNLAYLKQVSMLADQLEAAWVSDHLCWTGLAGLQLHDLLPLPYTEAMLNHVAARVLQVQDILNRPLVLENPSTYLSFQQDEMSEWTFLSALTQKTGCRLLLDVNNVYVSAFNQGFDAQTYLQGIPLKSVQQIHLAGHRHMGTHKIDTHDEEIIDPVWALYAEAVRRFGKIATSIERDEHIPSLTNLVSAVWQAKAIAESVFAEFIT